MDERDDEMDGLHARLTAELASGQMTLPVTMEMTLVAHCYERLGDRVPRRRTVRPVPAKAQPACGPVQAIARVRLAPSLSRQVFERHLRALPAVRSAVHVIGDVDYELRLECRDLAGLEVALASLRGCRGTEVASTVLLLGDVEGLGRRVPSGADWGTAPRPRQTRSA